VRSLYKLKRISVRNPSFHSVSWSSLALDLAGKVQWNALCPDYKAIGRAKVILDDGSMYGSVTRDGRFVIPDVPVGTYILSVLAHDHLFDQFRVDVFDTSSDPEIRPYIPGTPLSATPAVTLPYPLKLYPRQRNDYFVPPQSFNILGMFQNPMMLMMVGVGAMALLMPYLMKNMDPESLQDLKDQQSRIANIQNSVTSGDFKKLTSMLNDDDVRPKGAVSSGVASTPSTKNRSGKGKRR